MSEIRTHVISKEYEENAERIGLGKSERAKERGRFIWDERAGKLVRAEDYRPPEDARSAPVMVDRFYENTASPVDGSDIGSRRKYREHLKATGLTNASDFSPEYRERVKREWERDDDRSRRAAMDKAARTLYQQGKWR